jgi:hypothetical protein
MLPNLQSIETAAGKIALGATVRSTRYRDVQGLVTAIMWTGFYYSIQVAGRHSDAAHQYELLESPQRTAADVHSQNLNPHYQEATSGALEVLLPGEGDRIYFAETPQQVIALLAATIGLADEERELGYLNSLLASGRKLDEVRWRGYTGPGSIGQLAYVSTTQARPAPRFAIGAPVRFYSGTKPNTVSGVALYKDRLNYGKTQWHYSYEGAGRYAQPYAESHTVAEPTGEAVAAACA